MQVTDLYLERCSMVSNVNLLDHSTVSQALVRLQYKLNSIQSWAGSQASSGALPSISMTDIEGIMDHWPVISCLRYNTHISIGSFYVYDHYAADHET